MQTMILNHLSYVWCKKAIRSCKAMSLAPSMSKSLSPYYPHPRTLSPALGRLIVGQNFREGMTLAANQPAIVARRQ